VIVLVRTLTERFSLTGPVNECRGRIECEPLAARERQHDAAAGLMPFLEIVEPLDRGEHRPADRQAILAQRIPAAEQLQSLVQGVAMNASLNRRCDTEPVLEAQHRAVVEAEKVGGQIAEIAKPEIA
jgi:hypothetical protein